MKPISILAIVLIIGTALAAIILNWGFSFSKNMQTTTESSISKQVNCREANLIIKNVKNIDNELNFLIENKGNKKIEKIILRLTGSENTNQEEIEFIIDEYEIKNLNVPFPNKIGNLKKIEIIPTITIKDKETICHNNIASKEF